MVFKRLNRKGFTIIELMIAISVFSMAMMLVMAVVIGMGKQYQKATYTTQLNSASRSFHEELARDVSYNSLEPKVRQVAGENFRWMCFGNSTMYAWIDSVAAGTVNNGLFKGQDSRCTDSSQALAAAQQVINTGVNLLPSNGFVKSITVDSNGAGSFVISTDFRSGMADMFVDSDISKECLPTLRGGDFCSVVQYNNVVKQRL